tara:strand:+ start:660 stop:776 length:117 start_codon:yes stop_codon:yes gene_type:complete
MGIFDRSKIEKEFYENGKLKSIKISHIWVSENGVVKFD